MECNVILNGVKYESKCELQTAIDFVLFKSKQYKIAGEKISAFVIDAKTGETVYCYDGQFDESEKFAG